MNDFSLINRLVDRDEFSHLVSLIDKNALFAFACTCTAAYKAVLDLKERLLTTFSSLVSSISLIKWAMSVGCPSLSQHGYGWAISAAKGGHLDVIRWMRYNYNMRFTTATASAAAGGGHLDVLKYLYMNSCPWDKNTCSSAAEGGHLVVLQWARANGCPWDRCTCMLAAAGGHLTVLQWAHANGCEFKSDTCQIHAAMNGQLDVVKWIHEQGYPWHDYHPNYHYSTVCNVAVSNGKLDILK